MACHRADLPIGNNYELGSSRSYSRISRRHRNFCVTHLFREFVDQRLEAINLAGNSGNALFANTQALLFSGDKDAALDLALDTIGRDDIEYGSGTRGGLALSAVAMLMKRGDYLAAEQVLLKDIPELAGPVSKELPESAEAIGGSWHRIQALAAIYVSTGRVSEGQRLSLRLALITEDVLRPTRTDRH